LFLAARTEKETERIWPECQELTGTLEFIVFRIQMRSGRSSDNLFDAGMRIREQRLMKT